MPGVGGIIETGGETVDFCGNTVGIVDGEEELELHEDAVVDLGMNLKLIRLR